MKFRYLAVGPWAGWSQEEIERDILRAQILADDGVDQDEEETERGDEL